MKTSSPGELIYSEDEGIRPFSVPPISEYIPFASEYWIEELQDLARRLTGLRMLELNSTSYGGGVAEMLSSSIPFLNQLGIKDEWRVMRGTKEFFEVTKEIHNLLQGKGGRLTPEMEEIYFSHVRDSAGSLATDRADVVIVHDPQPLGLASYLRSQKQKWLWRCHIDIDEDSLKEKPDLWDFINFWSRNYDAGIFSAAYYIVACCPLPIFIIPPFIDPLSEKNRELSPTEVDKVLDKYGIDKNIPIVSQIGRFDPWKGIGRTIHAFRKARSKGCDCQLIIAGNSASDDPEGQKTLSLVQETTEGEEYIHVLDLSSLPHDVNAREINAIQRASRVIFQPSLKEGFGLTVTEAMFKGKPVIASSAGGILLQLRDEETGFCVESTSDMAEKLIYLLKNPGFASEMGKRGMVYVLEHFLMPTRIGDYLKMIDLLLNISGDNKLHSSSIVSFHPWYKLSKRKSYEKRLQRLL
jgi:trehalose synthase